MFRYVTLKLCRFQSLHRHVRRSFCILKPYSRVLRLPPPVSVFTVKQNDFHEKKINQHIEQSLKTSDKIPDEYSLIYRAPYKFYIKICYYCVAACCTTWPIVQLFALQTIFTHDIFPINLAGMPLVSNIYEHFAYSAIFLFMTYHVAAIVFTYPLRIYADKDRTHYIAMYHHVLPEKMTGHQFPKSDITRAKTIMPWKESVFCFGKRKAILMEDHFISPVEFNRMTNECF